MVCGQQPISLRGLTHVVFRGSSSRVAVIVAVAAGAADDCFLFLSVVGFLRSPQRAHPQTSRRALSLCHDLLPLSLTGDWVKERKRQTGQESCKQKLWKSVRRAGSVGGDRTD